MLVSGGMPSDWSRPALSGGSGSSASQWPPTQLRSAAKNSATSTARPALAALAASEEIWNLRSQVPPWARIRSLPSFAAADRSVEAIGSGGSATLAVHLPDVTRVDERLEAAGAALLLGV